MAGPVSAPNDLTKRVTAQATALAALAAASRPEAVMFPEADFYLLDEDRQVIQQPGELPPNRNSSNSPTAQTPTVQPPDSSQQKPLNIAAQCRPLDERGDRPVRGRDRV